MGKSLELEVARASLWQMQFEKQDLLVKAA